MSLSIKIVTTANRTRFFYQSNDDTAKATIERLTKSSAVFSGLSLVISSSLQTEVFSPKRIAIIEMDADSDLSSHLNTTNLQITALKSERGDQFSYDLEAVVNQRFKVDFYFVGGFVLSTEVVLTDVDASLADRTRWVAQLFEQPVIAYQSSNGGVGLMNPLAMTRTVITPSGDVLPSDTLIVDDY